MLNTEKGSPAESIYPKLGYIKVKEPRILKGRKLSDWDRWVRSQTMQFLLLMGCRGMLYSSIKTLEARKRKHISVCHWPSSRANPLGLMGSWKRIIARLTSKGMLFSIQHSGISILWIFQTNPRCFEFKYFPATPISSHTHGNISFTSSFQNILSTI